MNDNVKNQIDRKIAFVICIHLVIPNCKNMLVGTSQFFYKNNNFLNFSIFLVIGFAYLWLIIDKRIYKRISAKIVFPIIISLLFTLCTFLFDPERFTSNVFPYNYVGMQFRNFIVYCFPLCLLMYTLRDYDYFINKLVKYTGIMFLVATFAFICSIIPSLELKISSSSQYYSMGYGNAIVLLCLLLLFKIRESNNIMDKIQFILTTIYLLLSGSRGRSICCINSFCNFIILRCKTY